MATEADETPEAQDVNADEQRLQAAVEGGSELLRLLARIARRIDRDERAARASEGVSLGSDPAEPLAGGGASALRLQGEPTKGRARGSAR